MGDILFGGLDLAKRVDLAAFVGLKYNDTKLIQYGQKTWFKVNYKKCADDLLEIQKLERFHKICFDRSGVGDAAIELFSKQIPMEEVVSSAPTKLAIINLVVGLFNNDRLTIVDSELRKQIKEQEKNISKAGNELYRHPSGKHDDVFWALGYACWAAREYIGGITKTAISFGKKISPKSVEDKITSDIKSAFGSGWTSYGR